MSFYPLPGLEQATGLDLLVLGLKLMGTGVSLGLLAVVAMGAWFMRNEDADQRRTYSFFIVANLFTAMYVAADTGVRIAALQADTAGALQAIRIAIVALMVAMAAYICLYWVMESRLRTPWRRISALYGVALTAAALVWVEQPAAVIASDQVIFRGLSAFPDYGAASPWYFTLLLMLVGGVVVSLLRSPLRHTDRAGWWLNLEGLAILLLTGMHDALREQGIILLPFPLLWLGFAFLQLGAFGFLALHYGRILREHRHQRVTLRRLSDALARDRATGLYSRSYLQDLLDSAPAGGGLLFIDLDNFKTINDRYGHLCGDIVIGGLADLLRTGMRDGDIACRWGGDEFVVYLRQGAAEQAHSLATRLQERAARLRFDRAPGLQISLSMGYAPLTDGDWRRTAELADKALYQSKRAGKGRLTVAHEEQPVADAATLSS